MWEWDLSVPLERSCAKDCSDNSLPSAENCNMSRWELGTQNYEARCALPKCPVVTEAIFQNSSRTKKLMICLTVLEPERCEVIDCQALAGVAAVQDPDAFSW